MMFLPRTVQHLDNEEMKGTWGPETALWTTAAATVDSYGTTNQRLSGTKPRTLT